MAVLCNLSLARCAEGLNLVMANHVIVIEPNLSLSVERQAIGRCYRIGEVCPLSAPLELPSHPLLALVCLL